MIALSVAVGACSPSSDASPGPEATSTTPPQPVPLECEAESYPCSPAEVPVEIHERSDALSDEALAMFADGASMADVDAWLASRSDMAEVESDEHALRFRLDGGRGTWILRSGALGTRSAPAVGSRRAVPTPAAPPLLRVVGDDSDQKSALVLSPMLWDFGATDDGAAVAGILAATRGYEGRVVFAANEAANTTNVNIESFKGWGEYDVVHVVSHGTRLCDPAPCRAAIAAGTLQGAVPPEPGVEVKDALFDLNQRGVELAKVEPGRGFQLAIPFVFLTADFFLSEYPGGLENTMVFFNSCESFSAEATDLGDAIRGRTSVFFGWTEVVDSNTAHDVAVRLYEDLSSRGYTLEEGFERLGVLRIDPVLSGQLVMGERAAGGDLRIRDVVHLLVPGTDRVLAPTDDVPITGVKDDGEPDSVPYWVRVDGITDEFASDVVLHVALDGEEAEPRLLSEGSGNDRDQWTVSGEIPLGYDLEEDKMVDFRAWVELHSTGESDHETPAQIIGVGSCLVGTWAVVGRDVANLHQATVGDAAESSFADGSLTATFRGNGTVTYEFGGWSVGNTTFTPSPIEGVIAELHGRVATTSSGTARGTWAVEGDRLRLTVGDFDTTVIQRIQSPVLEIDSTVRADPHLARLYVIPNGLVPFQCAGDTMAVAWDRTGAIRWTRIGDAGEAKSGKEQPKS